MGGICEFWKKLEGRGGVIVNRHTKVAKFVGGNDAGVPWEEIHYMKVER